MNIKIGLTNESFKLCRGHDAFRNDSEIYSNKSIKLAAAKGLDAAFQIVIESGTAARLSVGDEPVFSKSGMLDIYRLEAEFPYNITLSHIGMVTDDDLLERGDILLSHPAAELSPGCPSSVFAQINIPRNAEPKDYTGKIRVFHSKGFEEETCIEELTFETKVFDYTLPAPANWRFKLDLWQHHSNIARKAEAPLWSERHFAVLEGYVKSLADLGQKSITIIASEMPWSGQSCFMEHRNQSDLFEYSMINIFEDEDGKYKADFSAMDRYVALCDSNGFAENCEIEIFGLVNIWRWDDYGYGAPAGDYPEAIRVRVKRRDGSFTYMRNESEINWYLGEIEKHCIETGIIDRVKIIADEPSDIERFRKSLNNIKKHAPSFRFKAAINHAEFVGKFGAEIDSFVPSFQSMLAERETLNRYCKEMPEKDFLWYVCCGPDFPNTFIRSSLLESRAIGYITFAEGYDGFLRWNYTIWPEEPRKDLRYPVFPCGDMNFVYPAGDLTPLLSLRYQALRRGIEDFEMMSELKEKGKINELEEILKRIILTNGKAESTKGVSELLSLDEAEYSKAREKMLMLLSGN